MCHNSVTFCTQSLVALGANLPSSVGAPQATLRAALGRLGDSRITVAAHSRLFATPCFPAGAGPDYVNAAAVLTGVDDPAEVLDILHGIEAQFGRRRGERWGSRSLDLDLLAVGDAVRPDRATFRAWHDLPAETRARNTPDRLILPHPRLHERAFVLIPLLDVAPDWRHPLRGQTVREMAAALPKADRAAVKPL